ncbi:hypothetical protein ACWCPF_30450 [Streptomyces sp. NPDC001858]
MTTGRAPRAGATARLLGPALPAGALATTTGCGGPPGDSTATRTPSPSSASYEILRTVVDAARAAEKTQGADAADELSDRETRVGCTDGYRSGGPGEGPWQ